MELVLGILGLAGSAGWLLWLRRHDQVEPRHRAPGAPRILDGRRTG